MEDFNYGTLLRLDCEKDYSEENSIFGTFASPQVILKRVKLKLIFVMRFPVFSHQDPVLGYRDRQKPRGLQQRRVPIQARSPLLRGFDDPPQTPFVSTVKFHCVDDSCLTTRTLHEFACNGGNDQLN